MAETPAPETIRAICETLVPRVASDTGDAAYDRLMGLSAVDQGVDQILLVVLPGWSPHVRALIARTVEGLGEGFAQAPAEERERRWRQALADPKTYPGAIILQSTVFAMFYTNPDEAQSNPTWEVIGYPGPRLAPPSAAEFPKTLRTQELPAGAGPVTLTADAVVVGSGAGGGVAAATLAEAGLRVLVLEKGSYRNEPDLPQLEALSFPNLYLGGGFAWSTDASAGLLAGSTVGGGTTVNSMASLPTPDYVLAEWTGAGMEDADPETFGAHLARVMTRVNATTANTRHNRANQLLNHGFDARGLAREDVPRNARDADDRYCGECNAGCLTGCKQSTMKTFLQDASDHGALLLANCDVTEVHTEDGRALGVRAVHGAGEDAREIVVDAPIVVLAAGALATPLLLESSGIGGPAVGENLHIHPSYFMSGVYEEELNAWAGQILTTISHEFAQLRHGHGFEMESAPMGLGFWTSLTPWHSGEQHKRAQTRLKHIGGIWGFTRDYAAGTVRRGQDGLPLVAWGLDDPVDLDNVRDCHVELARTLRASGAVEIFTFLPADPRWREGEDFEAFLDRLRGLSARDILSLSAHQSGSAATGTDPETSVVDGRGELHDVRGVYVADASALPTAPGVNPMISIEAFAAKTAGHIVQDRARLLAQV